MKKLITVLLIVSAILPGVLFAQPNQNDQTTFPLTNWISKNSNDPISIQNGAGTRIFIVINVSGGGANAPGVTVKNCGTTNYIKSGSSTVCETNDNKNPVTLTSESVSVPATGTYQIKTQ